MLIGNLTFFSFSASFLFPVLHLLLLLLHLLLLPLLRRVSRKYIAVSNYETLSLAIGLLCSETAADYGYLFQVGNVKLLSTLTQTMIAVGAAVCGVLSWVSVLPFRLCQMEETTKRAVAAPWTTTTKMLRLSRCKQQLLMLQCQTTPPQHLHQDTDVSECRALDSLSHV